MKILIADDDRTMRVLLRTVLTKWGYAVCEATNGQEAGAHFISPYSALLAILDWMMPGMSGPDLCRRLKAPTHARAPYVTLLTSTATCDQGEPSL